MHRQFRIDLAEQLFEAIDELAMPGQKSRPAMHVGRLVNLILLDPLRYPVGVIAVVHLYDRVPKAVAFCLTDVRDVAANAVPKCHDLLLLTVSSPLVLHSCASGGHRRLAARAP